MSIKPRYWLVSLFLMLIICCGAIAILVIEMDLFFHFHKPKEKYSYALTLERYQNDGIVRNFTYDGVVTGTSMTENFFTTEVDVLFGAKSVKVPFAGAHYKEVNDNLKRAFSSENSIKFVIRGLDYGMLSDTADAMRTDMVYPTYLYNNNWLDDSYYVWNKDILFGPLMTMIHNTADGKADTTFDEYGNWSEGVVYGKEAVLASYEPSPEETTKREFTEEDLNRTRKNIVENVTELVAQNPDTTFYYFLTPYSIVWWNDKKRVGELEYYLKLEEVAIEEMLQYDNLYLFSFFTNEELICNLENYKDVGHYSPEISSKILEWMAEGKYRLTKDNYKEYLQEERDF